MVDAELAYLAGFFDGEGCVSIIHTPARGEHYYEVRVSANQVDPSPLYVMQRRFGGRLVPLHRNPEHRQIYGWIVTGPRGREALEAMLPFLTVKRTQAILAVEFQKGMKKGQRITPELIEQRRELAALVAAEKRQIYPPVGVWT